MFIKLCRTLFLLFCLAHGAGALAATASSSGSGSNTYLFIENNIDGEYVVTPGALDPRFSGANVWTKYSTNQTSLGYMGYVGWVSANSYYDMWIDNSPIAEPLRGIRCMTSGSTCPAVGYIAGAASDANGFYHALAGSSVYNGSYGFASFSPAAYEYFREKSVGSSDSFTLNWCYTTTDYDYASGVRCKDLTSNATWRYYTLTATKVGHLTLNSTGALSEIWVASDGTPSVNSGNDMCSVASVGGTSGVICKMVSYSLQQTQRVTASLNFRMVLDTATLGFTPAASTVRYSGDGATWYNYSASTTYSNVFNTSGNYVYVFLSNTFFNNILNNGVTITNNNSLFTFYFTNALTPESGYYQFTASNAFNITPKEYSISIVATDGSAAPSASGTIGSGSPIAFDYKVTTSASRQADAISAQVTGNSTTLNGIPYCLFTSEDGEVNVPIPAYLSYVASTGATVRSRNSCSEAAIDITGANWTQTAWNAAVDEGYYFTATLRLLFPMNDTRSLYTVNGDEWAGTVSASGEVKVSATWIGVDQ
ncbi:fimbrial protein [Brenneria izadpanahii]|uniref:Fimbrial protein n=1 Tax=Brenneria izadpanahii TaxID=2722756 RepID=A0ABX7UTH1_9GAMM|nr:fimbrial protein [Brenneria izadpanahii]QTF08590.1 fimbrial protein [Brenneria izadpanahii]